MTIPTNPSKRVLFLANSEYGQAQTHLSVAYELFSHRDIEVHIASFEELGPRIPALNQLFHSQHGNVAATAGSTGQQGKQQIHFHLIDHPSRAKVLLFRNATAISYMSHPPPPPLPIQTPLQCTESTRETPNIASPQASPSPSPSPALNILPHLLLLIHFIFSPRVPHLSHHRSRSCYPGLRPLLAGGTHTLTLPPRSFLPDADPGECGPITIPHYDNLRDQDAGLAKWLRKGSTVLINLGSHAPSSAVDLATTMRLVLSSHPSQQILWNGNPAAPPPSQLTPSSSAPSTSDPGDG